MDFLIQNFGYLGGYSIAVLFIFFRYAIFAGIPFVIFYHWRKQKNKAAKIQKREVKSKQIWMEIGYSTMTAFIFAALGVGIYWMTQHGWTKIYTDVNEYGTAYFITSIFILMFVHDAYFYWMHRAVHHPKIFPYVHKVHHLSSNPTPWTSFSFNASEAVLELGIVPIVLMLIPMHFGAVLIFFFISLAFNVMGHLGYEIMPKNWVRHPILKWFNTPTHHNMHHARGNGNFGLYFNFWDTWMGTNHKNYIKTFDAIVARRDAAAVEEARKLFKNGCLTRKIEILSEDELQKTEFSSAK